MDNCWNKYCVSFGSLALTLIRFQSSLMNLMACWSHTPPISMAMGTKMFVSFMLVYLEVFKVAAWLPAAPARLDVSPCAIEWRCRRLWHPTQVPFLSPMGLMSLHQVSCHHYERGWLTPSHGKSELSLWPSKWCHSGMCVSDVWLHSFGKNGHVNLSCLPLCRRDTYADHKFYTQAVYQQISRSSH